MKIVVYPGTFDPITNGHIDIIKRATAIFGAITVAVVKESFKGSLFSYSDRLRMVKAATKKTDDW